MACRPVLAATALACTLAASLPAQAHTTPHYDRSGLGLPDLAYAPPVEMRDGWLEECRYRLAEVVHPQEAAERCADMFDGYYDYYRQQARSAPYPMVQPMSAARLHSDGCCRRPAMHDPVMKPKCITTVEYEYVDAPVLAKPKSRPAPQKRIKLTPDKRVYVK